MSYTNLQRFHGIDFCRAVFMILGLFYHAGLIYGADKNWNVISDETSSYLNFFTDIIHQFRMEAFYVIAGFFYILVFSKSRDNFLKDRVLRAFVPLVFCGIILNSFMNYHSYNLDFSNGFVYVLRGEWLGHLWFLGNLILYFLFTFPLCKLILRSKTIKTTGLLLGFYFITPTIAILGLGLAKVITIDSLVVFFSYNMLLYYYAYFLLGCYCYKNLHAFLSILNFKFFLLSLTTFSLLSLIIYMDVFSNELTVKLLVKLSKGSLVLSMMALVYLLGRKDSMLIRRFSNSSYTIYILHQPLIVLLYVLIFNNTHMGALVEYFLLIFLVFNISYFFHVYVVKNNQIFLFLFNGVTFRSK
tara:strand:+ start:9476 stop:10546 length:1071 start_codon:yes stop_codon:yes gene_type:complete